MPPAKSSRNHDDSKADGPNSKEKGTNGHSSTKMRRNASQQNHSLLRELQNAAVAAAPQPPVEPSPPSVGQPPPLFHVLWSLSGLRRITKTWEACFGLFVRPLALQGELARPRSLSIQFIALTLCLPQLHWASFDRDVLHAYRREHRLNTPSSFSNPYCQWILSQPNGIGLHSPTMVRRRQARRQSKDQLALAVRKHFNGMGVQENDVIVDFIYKIRHDPNRISKPYASGKATTFTK
ncbi:Ff.00g029350.m01.CDS01 [Fusarium sp. VM40]|nr:Ff.00g029350.m01.CDS01 [Fusarium sp. VM40]